MAASTAGEHSDELEEFGYKQELDRSIGKFASFAAGVSYISILTGTFQLFYVVFFGALAYYWFVQRHKTGVLESHRIQAASEAVPPGPAQPAAAGGGSPE